MQQCATSAPDTLPAGYLKHFPTCWDEVLCLGCRVETEICCGATDGFYCQKAREIYLNLFNVKERLEIRKSGTRIRWTNKRDGKGIQKGGGKVIGDTLVYTRHKGKGKGFP